MHSVCILIYVTMYLYSYLSTHRISGLAARGDWEQFMVRLKMTIEWTQRYTPRPRSSRFKDAIGARDWVNSEMHREAVIEQVWRCDRRLRLSEHRDALGGLDRVSLDMHLKAGIEWTQRCTPSCDRASLEMHFQQAMIQGDKRSTWRWSI